MLDKKIDYHITLNESNVIKGVAICAMLWHHLFLEHPEYGPVAFKLALTCKMCVALFVFLSGYGMAMQYQKNVTEKSAASTSRKTLFDWLFFLLRRFSKFYLNYWFVFFLAIPLVVLVFGRTLSDAYGSEKSIWFSFLCDFWGLQVMKSYNITWWINRLFIVLWLFFPFLYWSMKSKTVSIWMLILLFCNPGSYLNQLNCFAPGFAYCLTLFTLGIFFAVNKSFVSSLLNKINKYVLLAIAVIATLAFSYMRNHYVVSCFLGVKGDPFIATLISLSVVCLFRLGNRKMVPLAFVGKHSMNIYLLHTFVFSYFFHDFIYGFKYPALIFFILLLISLMLSMILEYAKEIIGFYKFQNKIVESLNVR